MHYSGWLGLSTSAQPSWALVCRKAAGEEIVRHDDVWMTKARAHTLPSFQMKRREEAQKAIQARKLTKTKSLLLLKKKKLSETKTVPKKKFPINKLPYDVRHQILEEVAPPMIAVFLPGVSTRYFRSSSTKIPLPAITRAGDKMLRLETIFVCLKKSTFAIHSGPGNFKLRQWLASLDLSPLGDTSLRNGFDALQSLSFPYFGFFPHRSLPYDSPNNDIQLMRRCPNLQKVSIKLIGNGLINFSYNVTTKPIQQVREEYRLNDMLDLNKLQDLRLGAPIRGSESDAWIKLGDWFKAEYASRGKSLTVHIFEREPPRDDDWDDYY